MSIELSKPEKKIAREIIDKGLQKEVADNLLIADSILSDWRNHTKNNMDTYHALYRHMREFDKQIAWRYDNMSGSNYLLIIIGQLRDGVIQESDLQGFSEELLERIKVSLKL